MKNFIVLCLSFLAIACSDHIYPGHIQKATEICAPHSGIKYFYINDPQLVIRCNQDDMRVIVPLPKK